MVNLELGTVDNGKSMSEILRDALEAKGYSQREFAKKIPRLRRTQLRLFQVFRLLKVVCLN